jgi:predicted DNA-binding antitoxin AbrB/MazE fold protein
VGGEAVMHRAVASGRIHIILKRKEGISVEIEAVYEDGVLKPDRQLPLANGQRVKLTVQKTKRLHETFEWTGSREDLEYLLGPDNHPWAYEDDEPDCS